MSYNPFEEKRRTDTINLLRKENSHLLSENTLISKKLKDVEYKNRLLEGAVRFLESSKPKWIKIESEEDLPKEYGEYIVRLKSGKVKGVTYYAESKRFYTGGNVNDNPVTHWMNLPQSPKED